MKFRTEVEITRQYRGIISHSTPVATLGSCFAEEVGARLRSDLFNVAVNPFGPVFNPESLANILQYAADDSYDPFPAMTERDGHWVSFDFHSKLFGASHGELAALIRLKLEEFRHFLKEARFVTLTLGTSRVFRHRTLNKIVTNCHKVPAAEFEESHLTPERIALACEKCYAALRSINPYIRVIMTVSPVRHGGHSLHEDRLSKSRLLLGVEQFVAEHAENGDAIYFPAYEIVTDELRDYRFYAADMMHPAEQAVDYVYERFGEMFFSEETERTVADCRKVMKRIGHRPLSEDIADYINRVNKLATTLSMTHPEVQEAISRHIKSIYS